MKIAVVNMDTVFSDVKANMKLAEEYIKKASQEEAEMIVFPEFFTTGFALNNKLINAALSSRNIGDMLLELSRKYKIAIGGSYLNPDKQAKEIYNTFGLFFPTGETFYHNKDIPTALENFCYTNGDENRVFETPLGRIGVAMCWEQIRYNTIREMAGLVDFVVAGSCWWGFTPEDGEVTYRAFHAYNHSLAVQAPQRMAELLGVPVIHASHCGSFPGLSMMPPQKECMREVESHAMVVTADGQVMKTKEDAGLLLANIEPGCIKENVDINAGEYWIPKMPKELVLGFDTLNEEYKKVYIEKVKPII